MKRVLTCFVVFVMLMSCIACGSPVTVKNDVEKAGEAGLRIDGKNYDFNENNAEFSSIKEKVADMLGSAKKDPNASEQIKTDCTDSAVEYAKSAWSIWFEFHIDGGKYKKIFFKMDTDYTQSILVYATTTESYDDGILLTHYSCYCKDVVLMINSYKTEN